MDFEKIVEQVAEKYQAEGYTITLHPGRGKLPSFAADFGVDFLAIKGDEHVAVQVKASRDELRKDPDTLKMAEVINAQPGWRFDLVVINAETPKEQFTAEATEPTLDEIQRNLDYAEKAIATGDLDYPFLISWGSLEAAMRNAARSNGLEVKTYTPSSLLRVLYSNGLLERDEFDWLNRTMKIRNAAVHGMSLPRLDPNIVQYLIAVARNLISPRKPESKE